MGEPHLAGAAAALRAAAEVQHRDGLLQVHERPGRARLRWGLRLRQSAHERERAKHFEPSKQSSPLTLHEWSLRKAFKRFVLTL